MNYQYILNIKGISASGKSSRLHCLVAFLASCGFHLEDFVKPDDKGKDQSYGTLVKELNLIILGKDYEKDGVRRFQGFDSVTGRQQKSAGWSEFITECVKEGYSVIVEGAGITNSFRYRPEFLHAEMPNLSLVANWYYNFESHEKQEYLDRVKYRSGKIPKKDSMWDNHPGIYRDYEKSVEEAAKIPNKKCVAGYYSWSEPIWHLGELFFTHVYSAPDKVEAFKKFCENYKYIETNKYSGPPIEEDSADTDIESSLGEGDTTHKEELHPGNRPKTTEDATKRSKGEDYMTTSGQMYRFSEEKKKAEARANLEKARLKTSDTSSKEVPAINTEQDVKDGFGMSVDVAVNSESISVTTEITKEGDAIRVIPQNMCSNCEQHPYDKHGDCQYCGHKKSKSISLEFSGKSKRNNPKTESTIFPMNSIDRSEMRWEDHLYDFTPVEKVGKLWFKREDRFAPLGYGGLNGSKLRQCIWMVSNFQKTENSMLISGASVKSPQLPMGTAVARHFGMKSVHIIGATNPKSSIKRDMVEMATWLGSMFQYESVGYNPYLQKATRTLHESRNEIDFYLNYGITPAADATDEYIHGFHAVGAFQTQNIPANIEKIIIPTGSTNSCISILYGLTKFKHKFPNLKDIYLIGIGPDKTKMIETRLEIIKKLSGVNTKNFVKQFDNDNITEAPEEGAYNLHYRNIFLEGYTDYQSERKFSYEGIEFHPTYEGKVMSYVSENMPEILTEDTMLWIVGSKPRIGDMAHMKSYFGDIPKEVVVFQDNSSTLKQDKPEKPKKSVEEELEEKIEQKLEEKRKFVFPDDLDIPKEQEEVIPVKVKSSEILDTDKIAYPEEHLNDFFESIKMAYSEVKGLYAVSVGRTNTEDEIKFSITLSKTTESDSTNVDNLLLDKIEDPNIKSTTLDVSGTQDAEPVGGSEEMEEVTKIPFKEEAPHIPVGRGTDDSIQLSKGMNFKDVKVRRQVFMDFYEFHLLHKAHPGAVYYVFPEMFEMHNMDIEQRLWFVFINGCTQNVVTTWMIYKNFPNIYDITFEAFEEWHRANWKKLHYDIDRRYQKGHMVEMWQDYMKNLNGKTQVEFFSALASTGSAEDNFWNVWNVVINNFKWYGRLSTYSYLEYLKIVGLNISCPSLFLYEKDGSKSPRNGLCKVLGRDDLDWHKDNPTFKGYGKEVLEWLEKESHLLLSEAQEKFKNSIFINDVNFFTLESTLCCFKSWFRKNRRYPNVYNDMFYDRIVKMEAEDWGENDLQMFWDIRAKYLPEYLRMESNPDDLGIHPFKQNWFRETGEVIMMDKLFPVYENNYQSAREAKSTMKRRNIRPEEVSCSIEK